MLSTMSFTTIINIIIVNWAANKNSQMIIEGNSFLSADNINHNALAYRPGYDNSKLVVKKNYFGTRDEKKDLLIY